MKNLFLYMTKFYFKNKFKFKSMQIIDSQHFDFSNKLNLLYSFFNMN